jgi:hypothetical protein
VGEVKGWWTRRNLPEKPKTKQDGRSEARSRGDGSNKNTYGLNKNMRK